MDEQRPKLPAITVRLPMELKKQMARKAFERGVSLGEYVRGVLAARVDEDTSWRSEVAHLLAEIRDLLNQALNRRREG